VDLEGGGVSVREEEEREHQARDESVTSAVLYVCFFATTTKQTNQKQTHTDALGTPLEKKFLYPSNFHLYVRTYLNSQQY